MRIYFINCLRSWEACKGCPLCRIFLDENEGHYYQCREGDTDIFTNPWKIYPPSEWEKQLVPKKCCRLMEQVVLNQKIL